MNEDLRLGVFICECGEEIKANLDLEALEEHTRELPGVVDVRRVPYSCSTGGLAAIESAIAADDLGQVLVAGCTPRTLEPRLRTACARSGVDGDCIKLVDVRESCAWAHPKELEAATLKAADLIHMGIAELRLRIPFPHTSVEPVAGALVIGSGIAGLTAARILADEGLPVKLVGHGSSLHPNWTSSESFPTGFEHPGVQVLLGKEVTEVSGTAGRYSITLCATGGNGAGSIEFQVGAILVASNAPRDVNALAYQLGIPQDADGRFPSTRFRLRPASYIDRGIYVCGAPHLPMGERDAEFQGASAALAAVSFLTGGIKTNESPAAVVDERLCTGCATCVTACSFSAIAMREGSGVLDIAEVDSALCSACGNCAVECPSSAIELPWSSDASLFAQIDAALQTRSSNRDPRVIVFGCEWSGQIAAELAGARRLKYPTMIRPITLECSARFDPTFALWAFHKGADGVMLMACRPGKCHFAGANQYAQKRIESLRSQLTEKGFDARRLQLEWVTADDPETYVRRARQFSELISKLSPRRELAA